MTEKVTKPRPVKPSTARRLAQFWSLEDDRCASDLHVRIAHGEKCPACGLTLFEYADALYRLNWPEKSNG